MGESTNFVARQRPGVQHVSFEPRAYSTFFIVTTENEYLDTRTRAINKIPADAPKNTIVQLIVGPSGQEFLFDTYYSMGHRVDFDTVDYVTRLELARRLYPQKTPVTIINAPSEEQGIPIVGAYRM